MKKMFKKIAVVGLSATMMVASVLSVNASLTNWGNEQQYCYEEPVGSSMYDYYARYEAACCDTYAWSYTAMYAYDSAYEPTAYAYVDATFYVKDARTGVPKGALQTLENGCYGDQFSDVEVYFSGINSETCTGYKVKSLHKVRTETDYSWKGVKLFDYDEDEELTAYNR